MNSTDSTTARALRYFQPFVFFRYLPPINLTLAVYIIIQNAMVIYHYSKDWKKLSSFLFLVIAAVDIGSACSAIVRGSITLLCVYNLDMAMPFLAYVTIIMCGNLCYVTSLFFGMVLTVVKTINIINPFYTIRGGALKLCLVLVSFFGLSVSVVDTIFMDLKWGPWMKICKDHLFSSIGFIGIELAIGKATLEKIMFSLFKSKSLIDNMEYIVFLGPNLLELFLPGLIVFVCMILQIVHIKRAFKQSADPRQNVANHATITVFMISFLYLSSTLVHFCSLIVFIALNAKQNRSSSESVNEVRLISWFTLSLVNAALFPTVLILRKAELRATYRGYIWSVLHLPVTVFNKIRHRVGGYTEI